MSKIQTKVGRRGRDQNQLPDMSEIAHQDVMRLAAMHGYDQVVLMARRDGDDGGFCVVTSGIGVRNGKIAQELGEIIKGMTGMKEVDQAADAELAAAKREMAEAPEGGDPETGKKLIDLSHTKRKYNH